MSKLVLPKRIKEPGVVVTSSSVILAGQLKQRLNLPRSRNDPLFKERTSIFMYVFFFSEEVYKAYKLIVQDLCTTTYSNAPEDNMVANSWWVLTTMFF